MSAQPVWYYRFIIRLLQPLYRLNLWYQAHIKGKKSHYHQEIAQRFAKIYPPKPSLAPKGVIWCHAVSLGETNTIAPLLEALMADGYGIWLTNTTKTGFDRAEQRFAEGIKSGQLSHSFVPVDTPAVINRFLNHVQPIAALFVETELWANSLAILKQRNLITILVNARLSEKSFLGYQKIAKISRNMMENLDLIIAQDADSAKRFRQLGASSAKIRLTGSLKWAVELPKSMPDPKSTATKSDFTADLTQFVQDLTFENRPIWVAASTHEGEEQSVLLAQKKLIETKITSTKTQNQAKDPLLILVPRHPERFDSVAEQVQKSGLNLARRSQNQAITPETQVYLADTMGELPKWYALADVAFIGGSLVNIGGHNPIEAVAVGVPVLMGQYTQSCQTLVDKLAQAGALQVIDQLYPALHQWLSQPVMSKQAGKVGQMVFEQEKSVLQKQLTIIEQALNEDRVKSE